MDVFVWRPIHYVTNYTKSSGRIWVDSVISVSTTLYYQHMLITCDRHKIQPTESSKAYEALGTVSKTKYEGKLPFPVRF